MEASSWIRRMFEEGLSLKKKYGADRVFDFSLGNPIMEPPPEFKEALERVLRDSTPGMHRYMPNAGYTTTRAVVAEGLAAETGLSFKDRHILMCCGAGGGLNVILKTLLDPGEEVIFFSPFFPEYTHYVNNAGGTSVVVPTDSTFNLDLEALEAALTERTKVVLYNSPNNPSGVVYPESTLHELGDLLDRHERKHGRPVYLISDDPYRKIVYENMVPMSVFRIRANAIQVYSHSKDLGLAGERIGFVGISPEIEGGEEIAEGMTFCNRILGFINAPAMMQHLVRELQGVTVDIPAYQRKRDRLFGALTSMGYEVTKPEGAFYLFPKTLIDDDVEFVRRLQEHLVLAVPGSGFGTPGHMRLSYCVDDRTIEGALPHFETVARQFVGA